MDYVRLFTKLTEKNLIVGTKKSAYAMAHDVKTFADLAKIMIDRVGDCHYYYGGTSRAIIILASGIIGDKDICDQSIVLVPKRERRYGYSVYKFKIIFDEDPD